MRILILGASGMLGSTLFRMFSNTTEFETWGSVRSREYLKFFNFSDRIIADIDVLNYEDLVKLCLKVKPDLVINCIGIIKQQTSAKNPLVAIPINSILPHKLAELCKLIDSRLVLISTDCVFSGTKGNYSEEDFSDAQDLYGRSKYLGEIHDSKHVFTIRTSIIGHELNSNYSLVDWFLSQTTQVQGYRKALFSGFTTVEIAKIIRNIIIPNTNLFGLYHLSANPISKHDLLSLIALHYKKNIQIKESDSVVIDRTLDSDKFKKVTKYIPPSWDELIKEMYMYRKQYYKDEKNV